MVKKHLLILSGILIINGLSAGDGKSRKVPIVRASKPAGQKISSADVSVDEKVKVIARFINGAIVEKRSDDDFHLPNPLLPLQKE